MSHVVGEVTYVELFKDAEGKSRVSVGDSALREVKSPSAASLSCVLGAIRVNPGFCR